MSDESRDIERLIADAIEDARDGELDEMRLAEIHDLLAASPEARRAYLEYNQLSRMLSAEQLPPVASDGAVAASGGVRRDPEAASNRFLSLAGWGIAAALLIGIVIASSGNNTGDQDSIQPHVAEQVVAEPPTAVLTRAIDIEWEHERRFQAELGQPVSERVLRVKSGIAEITFSSGATVTVEGSAKLRIDSPMSCFSMWGRFAANCPPSAHGFTVRFKGGKVVDLGTEFALDSEREGKTAVHVLSGEVIVAATDDEENVLQEISVKGNSAVELNPDTGGIGVIEY
ncbi:MAG TPA: hypothetical protein EYG09_07905, partial [Dehalococcoidia bacterium]|nr:hypothetical protein [Dehalococcoidia bacterium]